MVKTSGHNLYMNEPPHTMFDEKVSYLDWIHMHANNLHIAFKELSPFFLHCIDYFVWSPVIKNWRTRYFHDMSQHFLCKFLGMIFITHCVYITRFDLLNGAYDTLYIFLLILKIIFTYSLSKKFMMEFRFVLICCSIFLIFSRTKVNRMWEVLWAYNLLSLFLARSVESNITEFP